MKIITKTWLPMLLLAELVLFGVSDGARYKASSGRGSSRRSKFFSRTSSSRNGPPGPAPRITSEIGKIGTQEVVTAMDAKVPLNVDSRWGSVPQNKGRVKAVTNALNKNTGRKGNYVQGHLLNDNLGGAGMPTNLVPMSRSLNSRYEKQLEGPMKKFSNSAADANSGYNLQVVPNYVSGNPNPHSVSTRVQPYGNVDFQRKFGREMLNKGHFYDPVRDTYGGNFLNSKKSKFQKFPFRKPGGSGYGGGISEH